MSTILCVMLNVHGHHLMSHTLIRLIMYVY